MTDFYLFTLEHPLAVILFVTLLAAAVLATALAVSYAEELHERNRELAQLRRRARHHERRR